MVALFAEKSCTVESSMADTFADKAALLSYSTQLFCMGPCNQGYWCHGNQDFWMTANLWNLRLKDRLLGTPLGSNQQDAHPLPSSTPIIARRKGWQQTLNTSFVSGRAVQTLNLPALGVSQVWLNQHCQVYKLGSQISGDWFLSILLRILTTTPWFPTQKPLNLAFPVKHHSRWVWLLQTWKLKSWQVLLLHLRADLQQFLQFLRWSLKVLRRVNRKPLLKLLQV